MAHTTAVDTSVDTKWFVKDRFGMFIHWGLYSQAARHEWLQANEKIPPDEYERRYFKRFDPDLYDPRAWADAAAGAGMKYFVVTAKHHEGFCLWDSKFTDFKAPNTDARHRVPGGDLIRPMVNAFRERGLRAGLYYSLLDWHHPDYIVDKYTGPLRDHPDLASLNVGRDQSRYAKYMRDQVAELLTGYGDIDLLWFDFSYPKDDGSGKGRKDWESEELLAMIRRLRPGVMLTDRLDLPGSGNFVTPEQTQPREGPKLGGVPVVWEACQTFSGSWGYHRDESTWRSTENLVQTLIDCVSKGGNLLLNVGPTGRGEFDARALDRLRGIGKWMGHHGRSIYGCGQAPQWAKTPTDSRLTYNAETRRMYVHLFAYPYLHLHLDGLAGKVEYAQFLHDGSELGMGLNDWHAKQLGADSSGVLTLNLPHVRPDVTVPVVELFLKE